MMRIRTVATFPVGPEALLSLTPEQVRDRVHNLDAVTDAEGNPVAGLYKTRVALEFKTGETLEVDAVPKGQANLVEVLDEAPPARRSSRRAEAA